MKFWLTYGFLASLSLFWLGAEANEAPSSNGVISNPTLVANSSVAKAQAVGAITAFMSEGAKKCDDQGQNCHSLFGEDDTPDYNGLQQQSQALSGVQSFGFMEPDGDSSSIAAQTGTLAIACGNEKVQQVAGIAIFLAECLVNANGDARVRFRVCTAPSRNLPVTQPDNAVECSRDPTAPNFTAPAGKVCKVAACDTEAVGSLNGWSSEYSATWVANLPATASADQKAKNGLAMVFYPALDGSATPDFRADSDNMTAVKVVQSFINNDTGRTAVGMRVAYRHKTTVTKAMMEAGTSSVPNPEDHTQQWETLRKLQANALVPQYAAKYGRNGAECIQQINNGIGETGTIYVCDQTYSNESGIKPLAKSASIAVEGEDCGTTAVCVQKVVNTNTWQQSCREDVPLSMRTCTTTTDYTTTDITSTRTKATEICTEKRTNTIESCEVSVGMNMTPVRSDISFSHGASVPQFSVRTFTDIVEVKYGVSSAILTTLQQDNYGQVWVNGTLVWASYWPPGWIHTDYRNAYMATVQLPNPFGGGYYYDTRYYAQNGTLLGSDINDDGCNAGCRGLTVNLNVTSLLKAGTNKVEIVCVNARGIGPCYANFAITQLTGTPEIMNNGCAALEAAM